MRQISHQLCYSLASTDSASDSISDTIALVSGLATVLLAATAILIALKQPQPQSKRSSQLSPAECLTQQFLDVDVEKLPLRSSSLQRNNRPHEEISDFLQSLARVLQHHQRTD
jgi:hypothetical protein